ncbi:MAG: DNA repair protein RecO [Thermodesulfobacteria bacterium]|nr:DNA repair protein RecO [Thermodesulfobacteriota bacterium]
MFLRKKAIVLGKESIGEIDLLVELLTEDGKLWGIAKGGQKSKKRFLNAFEDLNYIEVHLRKNTTALPIIEKVDILFIPESLRYDLKKYFFSSYLTELLSKVSFQDLPADYFWFVVKLVRFFDQYEFLKVLKPFVEIKLLSFLGWTPELKRCVRCGYLPKRVFYFSYVDGGITCYKCRKEEDEFLEKNVVDILRKLSKMPLDRNSLNELEKYFNVELKMFDRTKRLVENFLKLHCDIELSSAKHLFEELNHG